jgi:hypothetical protein
MMITVCNNKLCKNRDTPCVVGIIEKGVAEIMPRNPTFSPWEKDMAIVPISVVYCKGG